MKRFIASFVLLGILSSSALVYALSGGELAKGEWPESVAIQWGEPTAEGEPHSCSGVIISPTLIRTAGHCMDGLKAGGKIRVNQYFQHDGGKFFTVKQSKVDERFVPNPAKKDFHWDQGFIEVSGADLGKEFGIEKYPLISRQKITSKEDLILVGAGSNGAATMQKQKDDRMPKRAAHFQVYGRDGDMFTMRSADGITACGGDSGGGVFRKSSEGHILVGVAVVGTCNAKDSYTAVHDLATSNEWFEKNSGYKFSENNAHALTSSTSYSPQSEMRNQSDSAEGNAAGGMR